MKIKNIVNIYFDNPMPFEADNIKPLNGIIGLYFIFSPNNQIQYPFDKSKLLYIGMSEKKTNGIGSRLIGHFEGKSKNIGLVNYRKIKPLWFTYINFEILKNIWEFRVEDLESYFILNFVENFGVYPICNNKTGLKVLNNTILINFKINWSYFK
ncbi:MAG: cysteine-rich KTR domain-containing protein [Endomicrobium sp.]|nr:cysteine-rich KTR domain-containing protein [Endomicrobium sp.]